MPQNNYLQNGVKISKSTLAVGDEVTLNYNGTLVQEGASSLIAHIGYGDNWDEKSWLPMEKERSGFKVKIKVAKHESLNVCFKDSSRELWDNNYHNNYIFPIEKKEVSKENTSSESNTKTTGKTAENTTSGKSMTKSTVKTQSIKAIKESPKVSTKATEKATTKPAAKAVTKPATKSTTKATPK